MYGDNISAWLDHHFPHCPYCNADFREMLYQDMAKHFRRDCDYKENGIARHWREEEQNNA